MECYNVVIGDICVPCIYLLLCVPAVVYGSFLYTTACVKSVH